MGLIYKTLLVICLYLHVNQVVLQTLHPYIVTINLRLKEEEIPRLIADSICGNNVALKPYFDYSKVSLGDIEDVIDEKTGFTLAEALKILNIGLDDIYYILSHDILMKAVNVSSPNIHLIYSRFLQHFVSDPMTDIPKILEILRIDGDKFGTAVVFGTDQEMLDILSKGSYSKTKLHRVLDVMKQNVTLDEVFDFLRFAKLNEAFSKIKVEPSLSSVIEAFNDLLVPDKVTNLFNLLSVTASDLYRNRVFNAVLQKVVDTQENLIGTAISADKIVTNSDSTTFIDYGILKRYSVLVAASIGNSHIRYDVADVQIPIQPRSFTLTTSRKLNFYQYVKFPTSIEKENFNSCSVISVNVQRNSVASEPIVAYFDSQNYLRINKTLKSIFNVGSPLICSNFLYGVADWEFKNNSISFIPVISSTELYPANIGYISTVTSYAMSVVWLTLERVCSLLRALRINICPIIINTLV